MDLEQEYQKLLDSLFTRLRENVATNQMDRSDAETLANMLLERCGIVDSDLADPLSAWNYSGCYSPEDNPDYNDGWNNSGCSF